LEVSFEELQIVFINLVYRKFNYIASISTIELRCNPAKTSKNIGSMPLLPYNIPRITFCKAFYKSRSKTVK
jgi:hypothetical protein